MPASEHKRTDTPAEKTAWSQPTAFLTVILQLVLIEASHANGITAALLQAAVMPLELELRRLTNSRTSDSSAIVACTAGHFGMCARVKPARMLCRYWSCPER